MDLKQNVDLFFEQEHKKGILSKETIKKIIEKIVDEFVKLKPISQVEQDSYALAATALIMLIYQKAKDMGVKITKQEIAQEIIKTFAKHSLDKYK